MNEIGQSLKDAREKAGVNLDEASKDLNIEVVILQNIEDGNIGCFKDIYVLKDYIQSYAKYLGLDDVKITDEFNEYLFEYTSKIPLKDIEKAILEKNKQEEKPKVVSPYTNPVMKSRKLYYATIYILIFIMVVLAVIWSIKQITINNEIINYVSYL